MFLTGCSSSERTTREIGLENPRSSSGILVKDPKDDTMDKLIAQFESNWKNDISSLQPNTLNQKSKDKITKDLQNLPSILNLTRDCLGQLVWANCSTYRE